MTQIVTLYIHRPLSLRLPLTLTFKTLEKLQQTFLEPTRQDEQFDI